MHVAEINEEMAARSGQRDVVAAQWQTAVSLDGGMEMADACTAKRRMLRPGVRFYHALAAQIICTIIQICNMVLRFFIRTGRGWENPVFFLITGIFFICTVLFGSRIIQLLFPESRFRALGNSVLAAGRIRKGAVEYYCVPELFSGSRQKAESFQRAMLSVMGRNNLIYTRNPAGRRVLLKARASSFFNRNDRCADQKKYIRGNLE